MKSANVGAVLFVKDLEKVAAFYSATFEMDVVLGDAEHSVLNCRSFELVVHQIPKYLADQIRIESPPHRRVEGAIRLNFPAQSIDKARQMARSLGGEVDDTPPPWANSDANIFLGYDPEGNVFAVSRHDR